jgi:hypothetical protein
LRRARLRDGRSLEVAEKAVPAGRFRVVFRLGRAVGQAVVVADECVAGGARAAGWGQAGVDEDFVVAECVVATFLEGDAVSEFFVCDCVVQAVDCAAVPGHVETWRS